MRTAKSRKASDEATANGAAEAVVGAAAADKKAVKTYPATINGRQVRVTIPADLTSEEALHDAIREHLSPKALAAVAAHLYAAHETNDESVNRQVRWLADFLIDMVEVDYEAFVEELGL